MKIHFVKYEFGNKVRLCDERLSKEYDTTDNIREVDCKNCLKKLK